MDLTEQQKAELNRIDQSIGNVAVHIKRVESDLYNLGQSLIALRNQHAAIEQFRKERLSEMVKENEPT